MKPKQPRSSKEGHWSRSSTANTFRGSRLDRYARGLRMNFGFTIVETSLNRAEFRWKWLRFWQRTLALGTILCLFLLLFGSAILLGWVTSKVAGLAILVALGVIGFITWVVVVIAVAAGSPD